VSLKNGFEKGCKLTDKILEAQSHLRSEVASFLQIPIQVLKEGSSGDENDSLNNSSYHSALEPVTPSVSAVAIFAIVIDHGSRSELCSDGALGDCGITLGSRNHIVPAPSTDVVAVRAMLTVGVGIVEVHIRNSVHREYRIKSVYVSYQVVSFGMQWSCSSESHLGYFGFSSILWIPKLLRVGVRS
jgi:hypothetical protein